jgi:hypothetical protein
MRPNDNSEGANPISQVLNDAVPTQPAAESHLVSAAPFSGKLIDLLLDTTKDVAHERRRADQLEEFHRSENSIITLPQPAQPAPKTARRPRIPPLLQGLHQPPPLPPSGRLFPPITDGVSGFEREIRDRIQSGNTAYHDSQSRGNEEGYFLGIGSSNAPHRTRDDHAPHGRDDILSPKPSTSKDNRRKSSDPKPSINVPSARNQKAQKRKKWSEDETRDLLLGVSKFGIGNWKKILHCPDFKFEGRTAVDLKDKFRVCCPAEDAKPRRTKRRKVNESEGASPETAVRSTVSTTQRRQGTSHNKSPVAEKIFSEGAGNMHKMDQTELAKLGIQTPFAKSTRRPRHTFSALDDENLLKGFERHGAAWLLIRDDKDLGFDARRPTDLRDRFRIRYPDAYAQAGLKVKPKPQTRNDKGQKNDQAVQEVRPTPHPNSSDPREMRLRKANGTGAAEQDSGERSILKASAMRPLVNTSSFTDLAPSFMNPNSDDEDGSLSPIVLNRNILQWADANTSSMSTSSGVYYGSRDTSTTTTTMPSDTLHINPMATLKLPMLTLSDHTAGTTLYNYNPTPTTSAAAPPENANANTNWSASSRDHLLRTPNLPTIVFPHVPAISARTTVHNLPTPADLLSGLDMESGDAGAFGGVVGEGAEVR